MLSIVAAQAQTYQWGGPGSTTTTPNYGTATNWENATAPVGPGQEALFDDTGSPSVNVGAPINPDAWTFGANALAFTITGSTVTFGGTGITIDAAAVNDILIANAIAGTGGIQHNGGMKLTLTGSNTYTGGTTICACATLQIGNGGTTGSIVGNVTVDGTLIFNRSDAYGFSGIIDGSGEVRQDGIGTLTLSGVNSYFGATTINAGTLAITNADALGTSVVGLFGGRLHATQTFTLSNDLYLFGTAAVTAASGTTLTLAGLMEFNPGSITTFGSPTDNGTIDVQSFGITPDDTSHVVIGGGRVVDNGALGFQLAFGASTTVASGATLDLSNSFFPAVRNLRGDGTVLIGPDVAPGFPNFGLSIDGGSVQLFSGIITGPGSVQIVTSPFGPAGIGRMILAGNNTYAGDTYICDCTELQIGNGGTTGAIPNTTVFNGGTLIFNRSDTYTFSGVIKDDPLLPPGGQLVQNGTGRTVLTNANTYTGATTVNAGTLEIGSTGSITSNVTNYATFINGGVVLGNLTNNGAAINNGTLTGNLVNNGEALNSGTLNGNLINSGTASNSGILNGDLTNNNIASNSGRINGSLISNNATTFNSGFVTGGAVINGGLLNVNGTIDGAVMLVGGAILSGNGTVGSTTVNSGSLSPGNSIGTLTVQGNLVLSSAAVYVVEIGGAAADRTNVTGTATIAGTVQASFANPLLSRYTILTANGGVLGTFGTFATTSMPAAFAAQLTYDANNVYLNLTSSLGVGQGLNQNQQNVATSLNTYFNGGGALTERFGALFTLTGQSLRSALSQVSGEIATQSAQAAVSSVDYFLNLMLDPFVTGRSGSAPGGAGANNFAADDVDADAYAAKRRRSPGEQDAYAAMLRKAPARNSLLDPRWSVWGAAYGGALKADGNAAVGARDASTRAFGFAAGADYRFSPDTLAGIALSGGGTSFALAQAAGSGRSDVFQAGAFVRHNVGQAYFKGALAYGWHDVTTDRTVVVAGIDKLEGRYNANSFAARGEAGYRFVTPWMGLTPYAAAQSITYFQPGYADRVALGLNTFALNYASRDVTSARSELGLRADKTFALDSALVTLRGRAAWAHYFDDNRTLTASFQSLAVPAFVVTGAAQARDAALVSASADVKWMNGISLAGVFEGELSGQTRGYAGKGMVRYSW